MRYLWFLGAASLGFFLGVMLMGLLSMAGEFCEGCPLFEHFCRDHEYEIEEEGRQRMRKDAR